MKLGFASAILPDLSLEEVVAFAAAEGFACVELMCWPKGKAERRYAGVTHIDVAGFSADDAARVNDVMAGAGVEIDGPVVTLDGPVVLPLFTECLSFSAPGVGALPGEFHFVRDSGPQTKAFR